MNHSVEALEENEALTYDATVISDTEEPLVDALETSYRSHHPDLVYVGRTLGYKLWEDGTFSLENSVALQTPRNERLAIRKRIDQTLGNNTKEVCRLEQQDPKSSAVPPKMGRSNHDVRRTRETRGSVDVEPQSGVKSVDAMDRIWLRIPVLVESCEIR